MLEQSFISSYNGKNLDEMKIPVRVVPKEMYEFKSVLLDEDVYQTVATTKILKDVYNRLGANVNDIAFVRFADIRRDCSVLQWMMQKATDKRKDK